MTEQQGYAGSRYIRIGWLCVALSLGVFLVWASLAPLDKGVVIDGSIMVSGHKKTVQPIEGGLIRAIYVSDGQWVEQGQTLLALDTSVAETELASATNLYYMTLAANDRLKAESHTDAALNFSSELFEQAQSQTTAARAIEMQTRLFEQRQSALAAEVQVLQDSLLTTEAKIRGLKKVVASHTQRLEVYAGWLKDVDKLVKRGFQSQEKRYELESIAAEVTADKSSAEADLLTQTARLAEIRSQIHQTRQTYRREVEQQRVENQSRLKNYYQQMVAARFVVENSHIKAPVAGQVVGLKVFTLGGVVNKADTLMEIVPGHKDLYVDARVPVNLIDSVQVGQEVELLFSAFNTNSTPKVKGEVLRLASDRLQDERTGEPYYQVGIRVEPEKLNRLQGLILQPGMPVQAFVKNGERSMLSYLLRPLFDRIPQAMSEN